MRKPYGNWLSQVSSIPVRGRIALATVLPLTTALLAVTIHALSTSILQLLLLASVMAAALLLGLATGLAAATLGFAVLLRHGMATPPEGGWSLSWPVFIDSFLWFAVAKLAAAVIAALRNLAKQLVEARGGAERRADRQELLLSELSHRVSNDLYWQVSLMRRQAQAEPAAAEALLGAASRMQILGRVHGRLSRNVAAGSTVDSRRFLDALVADIRASISGVHPVQVTIAAEAHALPVTILADVALAMNELITNALKHAFPNRRERAIRIQFVRQEDVFRLTVSDNGVGRTEGSAEQGGGFGNHLINSLAKQLGGRVDVSSGSVGGTVCVLQFPASPEVLPSPDADPAAAAQQPAAGGSPEGVVQPRAASRSH